MRELDPPMIARTVRFVPVSVQLRVVCLRVELYGCLSKGNIVNVLISNLWPHRTKCCWSLAELGGRLYRMGVNLTVFCSPFLREVKNLAAG